MRINKYLSSKGVCSRRQAEEHIKKGEVLINDRTAQLGDQVEDGDTVTFCGREIKGEVPFVLLAYNKPVGLVCSTAEKDNIIDAIDYPERIYPVGRLDKESDGLVILTNQGDLMQAISHAKFKHEKEYRVTIDREVTKDFMNHMSRGVEIFDGVVTRPCKVTKLSKFSFRIILTQGMNRQIRRMCEALGVHVRKLTRVRIMNIKLGDLKSGAIRDIQGEELEELKSLLRMDNDQKPAQG